jgi:hypothetical protein
MSGCWFASDSPLEGDGFELPVPRHINLCDRDGSHQTHCWRKPDSNSWSHFRAAPAPNRTGRR